MYRATGSTFGGNPAVDLNAVGRQQKTEQTTSTGARSAPFRLAVLATHPIQYQVPFYRRLTQQPEIDLTVFFCSQAGLVEYFDQGFGKTVQWDVPLLGGYRSHFLNNFRSKSDASRFWGIINPSIARALRRGQYDALLVHGWAHCTNWIAGATALALRVPLLLRGESNLLTRPESWKEPLKRAMLKKFFQRVAGFLVIGSHNAEFYQDFGVPKQKMCMTPYAVDNEYFMREADSLVAQRNEIRRRFEFPESLPLILFTGKLRDVKQPRALIEAYAQVVRKTPCALVFVGDGPLRADLEAYKQDHKLDHVYFVGFRNQSELPNFYATADVFVLPSKIEPWGLVINEAMCFGLPILTTDRVGAGKDLVQPGLNGFIFPADSVEALENYLTLVLSDSELRREMGIKSREIIRKWSYETGVNNLVVWLEQMRSTPKR